jgi:hypothetical protein
VRTTGVATFGALGTEDRFVTSSIPVAGSEEAGKEPRFVLTAIPSRFNLDLRTPTGVGAMRAFIEGDFAGDGRLFRLRHAYGQWKSLVIGQTWSTFADPEAEPDGIDFEGLNAIALFRQPLVRWTKPLGARFSLAAAVENPAPDITNAKGVSQVPDIVVRARWRPAEGHKGPLGLMNVFRKDAHVNLALLFRQIRGEPLDQPNTTLSTTGFGAGLSGRLTAPWQADKGQIMFSAYAGSGIGRLVPRVREALGREAAVDVHLRHRGRGQHRGPARRRVPHDEPLVAEPHLVADPQGRPRERVPLRQSHQQGRPEGRLEPAPARHELQVLRRH